ncbi:GOLPH3/VPS74 family protein [Streptomyces pinistramenti]|uniref:GOLPH3/VPS74 family protein n=1 Tax=Streptomyces pinistramenti TaxID=2884812 RepID=UPI001D0918E2|nr:GPP34 family phosphoprotein [Streptomyces pinistramenti]MCB5907907.1 GPP34 family phosphoprotein [Streptomyces pinistramenti]
MNGPPDTLTLAEELLLLALDPVRGRMAVKPSFLRYGTAGAALADLEAAGRIAVERGDRVVVVNPLPLGDPVLDGALALLPAPGKGNGGAPAHRWVCSAGRSLIGLCLRRLEERGAVRRESRRVLGILPYERFPAGPVDLGGPVRARFAARAQAGALAREQARAGGGREAAAAVARVYAEPRARMLGAHASAVTLDAKLLRDGVYRPLRRELRAMAKAEWTSRAALRAVQRDRNAANAGAGG